MLQSEEEFKEHLREQIEFLQRSSISYDQGYSSEAKRLAVVIRVLLHDTSSSTSLLSLLGKKDIAIYDTSLDYNPANLMTMSGLTMMRLGPSGAEYVPPLDDGPPMRYLKGKVPFKQWWDKVVIVDSSHLTMSRKELVLSLSNKDGGAHIDPKLNGAYAQLSRNNSLGWQFIDQEGNSTPMNGAELASIRQISHELLKSLRDEFPQYF